jgi:hypothetical protein
MNQLDFGDSSEYVDELTAFQLEPMSNKDLVDKQQADKQPPEAQGDDYQSTH